MISCLGLGRKKKGGASRKMRKKLEQVSAQIGTEAGKSQRKKRMWSPGVSDTQQLGDAAFSRTPANLMDMNSPLVPLPPPPQPLQYHHLGSCDPGGQTAPFSRASPHEAEQPPQSGPDLSASVLFPRKGKMKGRKNKD